MSVADHCCCAGTIVGVFVLEAVVLLVHTDHVLELDGSTLGVCAVAVEILDVAEAVTAQSELVGSDTEADITDIESLLAVVGSTGI